MGCSFAKYDQLKRLKQSHINFILVSPIPGVKRDDLCPFVFAIRVYAYTVNSMVQSLNDVTFHTHDDVNYYREFSKISPKLKHSCINGLQHLNQHQRLSI